MESVGLLVSDLDGTLLGDDAALEKFSAWRRRVGGGLRLAYSSGRFLDSVRASIKAFQLPTPDAIIGGVGTEIHDVAAGRQIEDWPSLRGGWDADVVMRTCLAHGRLALQPSEFISKFKISFHGHELDGAFLSRLSRQLSSEGQSATIVYSSNQDLDILPAGTHKGAAAAFLARHLRIDPGNVIVAGDSGNDLAMFHEGFLGIVVGNAQPELRSFAGGNVFHATRHFAAGVMEGLQHWHANGWRSGLQTVN